MRTFLVTGGAGFIGSALVRLLLRETEDRVVVVDRLTYAGSQSRLPAAERLEFVAADAADEETMLGLLRRHRPAGVFHLAAETHVDRSIDDPGPFLHSNVLGTYGLLEALRSYRREGGARLVHVSTDEVFGSLGPEGTFGLESPYDPRSPYAATKAASDHLARAWGHTYGLDVVVTNCTNNYGPYQYPEKLLPVLVLRALAGETLPIYGDGGAVRDWLHVDDHARALLLAFERGASGGTYLVGAGEERTALEIAEAVCRSLDRLVPRPRPYRELIRFVADRPGHDRRYALDSSAARRELGWRPRIALDEGLAETVLWYRDHRDWCAEALGGRYGLERLGLGG